MAKITIPMYQNIYTENEKIAREVNEYFTEKGIFVINVLGSPGTGKTSTLIQLIEHLKGVSSFVIEGDVESDIDTQKLESLGIKSFQVNTNGGCHLDALMIKNAVSKEWFQEGILKSLPQMQKIGNSSFKAVLFIENIGNLVCPAEFIIGEHLKIVISSVTEGSDKPYKYPIIFEKTNAVILNKIDLKPYLDFDFEFFQKGVRLQNSRTEIFEVSCKTITGFEPIIEFFQMTMGELNPA